MQQKSEKEKTFEEFQNKVFEIYKSEEKFTESMKKLAVAYERIKNDKKIPQELKDALKMCADLAQSPITLPQNYQKPSDIKDPDAAIRVLRKQFDNPEHFAKMAKATQAVKLLEKYKNHSAIELMETKVEMLSRDIQALVIQPVQRSPRYGLFFQEILKILGKNQFEVADSSKTAAVELFAIGDATAKNAEDVEALYSFSQTPKLMNADAILGLDKKNKSPAEMKQFNDIIFNFGANSTTTLMTEYRANQNDPKKASAYLALIAINTKFTTADRVDAYLKLAQYYKKNHRPENAAKMIEEASHLYNKNINNKPDVVLCQLGKQINKEIKEIQGDLNRKAHQNKQEPITLKTLEMPSLPHQREYLQERIEDLKEKEKQIVETKEMDPKKITAITQEKAQLVAELKALKEECKDQMKHNPNRESRREAKAVLNDVEKLMHKIDQKEPKTLMGRFKKELSEFSESRDNDASFKRVCKENNVNFSRVRVHRDGSATITVKNDSLREFLIDQKIKTPDQIKGGAKKYDIELTAAEFKQVRNVQPDNSPRPSPR